MRYTLSVIYYTKDGLGYMYNKEKVLLKSWNINSLINLIKNINNVNTSIEEEHDYLSINISDNFYKKIFPIGYKYKNKKLFFENWVKNEIKSEKEIISKL